MSPIAKKQAIKAKEKNASLLQIFKYCIPHMGIMAMLPITGVVVSLILRAIGLYAVSEFITSNIVLPMFILMPIGVTVKVINTLKRAFPRKTRDSHRILLSILLCSSLTTILIEVFFSIGCLMYGFFPLEFQWASYMRDMYASSPAAMNIFYFSAFVFYTFISLLIITAYFIGDRTTRKFKFTLSCLIFILFYVVFLILFLIGYFIATFLNIVVLENIQIANSIFNSGMLCAFLVFDILGVLISPALYFITVKFLNKKTKKK